MKNKSSGIILILTAGIMWGTIGLFTRALSDAGLSALQITAVRTTITCVLLALLLLCVDRSAFRIKLADIPLFLGTGCVSIVCFNVFYFITIERTTLAIAAILLYTSPFFVVIFSALLFHEKLTKGKLTALVLAFAGCVCSSGALTGAAPSLSAVLTGLASGFCFALYSIFGKYALQKYSVITVTFYTFLVAACCALPFSNPAAIAAVVPQYWLSMLLISLVCTLLPYLLYTRGLSFVPAGKASIMAFAEPLTATVLGALVFHEALSVVQMLGIALIFAGLVLLNTKFKKRVALH